MLTSQLAVRWISSADPELHSRNVSNGMSSNHYVDLEYSMVCAEMGFFCFSREAKQAQYGS